MREKPLGEGLPLSPKPASQYLIGLTGNIATGKTLVLERLRQHGAFCLDADKLAHECMRKGTSAWEDIRRRFGERVLQPGGEVDRAILGEIVFADPLALRDLEAIIHPWVVQAVEERLAASTATVAIVEAIKLLEASLGSHCQAIWVTTCAPELQAQRLMHSRFLSEEAAWQRIWAQPPAAAKVQCADVLLENDGSRQELLALVDQEWAEIEGGAAPGRDTQPGEPCWCEGTWRVSESWHQAAAVTLAPGLLRLTVSRPSRLARLGRRLLPTLEEEARCQGWDNLTLLVPARTGYRQFLMGSGYQEDKYGGREPGETAFRRSL